MMAQLLDEVEESATGHRSLVALRVDGLDAYCARIVERGGTVAHGPAPLTDRMRVAHLKDPEGNLVELQEWLPLSAELDAKGSTVRRLAVALCRLWGH